MGSRRGEKIEEMFQMVKDGKLRPGAGAAGGSGAGYRLDGFLDAFEAIATRRAIGKVVVEVAT